MHEGEAEGRGRRTAFVAALQKGLSVTGAAVAAGVNRTLLYTWRREMPEFAEAWTAAVQSAADLLEDEALRRALHGVERPVFYRGQQIGTITTYSDRLLALLLQRRRPVAARPGARARDGEDGAELARRLKAAQARLAQSDPQEEACRARAAAAVATVRPAPVPAPAPAPAPSADAAAEATPAPRQREAPVPVDDRPPPLSVLARTRTLTSAQALEALWARPDDPDMALFGPPWGPDANGRWPKGF